MRLAHIAHHRAQRRACSAGKNGGIEEVGREGFAQQLCRRFAVKAFSRQVMGNGRPGRRPKVFVRQRLLRCFGQEELGGRDARQGVGQLFSLEISGKGFPRRNIGPGQGKIGFAMANGGDSKKEIGRPRIKVVVFGQRAGGDQPHDRALDHRLGAPLLGFLGVLHLFADGHAMAQADQLGEVVIGGMDGHAAHADGLPQMRAAPGEDDAQGGAGDLGVLKEQLVEIAHAVEQQIAGMRRLDLEKLRHHRRQLRGRCGFVHQWRGLGEKDRSLCAC